MHVVEDEERCLGEREGNPGPEGVTWRHCDIIFDRKVSIFCILTCMVIYELFWRMESVSDLSREYGVIVVHALCIWRWELGYLCNSEQGGLSRAGTSNLRLEILKILNLYFDFV